LFQFDDELAVQDESVSAFIAAREEAEAELWFQSPGLRFRSGIRNSEAFPSAHLKMIVEGLSSIGGGRNRTQSRRWASLLRVLMNPMNRHQLGFFKVSGGVRSLATELGCNHSSLWRDLKRWQDEGLVNLWSRPSTSQGALVGLQIRPVTTWLIWVGSLSISRQFGLPAPTFRQTTLLLGLSFKAGAKWPPLHVATAAQVSAEIDRLQVMLQSETRGTLRRTR